MSRVKKSILTVIFIVSFGFTFGIERLYDNSRVLNQNNTLFDADSFDYLDSFSNGWARPNFRHPFAGLIFSLPIRGVAKLIHKATGADEVNTRRNIALLIIPLFQGIKNIFLYLIFVGVGLTIWQAMVMCGLNLFALSTITIGSIPETFPISSTAIVLFAWFMFSEHGSSFKAPKWRWILVGSFAIGITVTNIVPLAVFYFIGSRFGKAESIWLSIRQLAVVSISSLIITFIFAAALAIAFSHNPRQLLPNSETGDLGINNKQHRPAEELAIAAANTFAGIISTDVIPNELVTASVSPKTSLPIMFTFAKRRLNNWLSILWALSFAGLLILGAKYAYAQGPVWYPLISASVILLIFNFILHMFFYWHDMFLYALHWQVPMLFLLAGLNYIRPKTPFGFLVLFSFTIISAISGIQFVNKVISTITE